MEGAGHFVRLMSDDSDASGPTAPESFQPWQGDHRGLQDEGPNRGLQDEGPNRGLQDEEPNRGLQDEGPYRGLQDEGPYRGLQDEGPNRGLQDEGPYRGLQDEGPYRGLQDEGPYRGLQDEEPYRGLQDEGPYRGLQDEGPNRGLQDEGLNRGLQDEEPYRGLQEEGPYRGLQDEGPNRGLQDEGPNRGLQEEGTYKGQQSEGLHRHEQEVFPVRDWDPNLPLKNLPLSMQEKRSTRDRRQQQRLSIGCWESWRRSQRIARRRLWEQVVRAICGLQPWRKTLHTIEGKFGMGVKAYFTFLRYLLYLNLMHSVLMSGLALTPALLNRDEHTPRGFQGNDSVLDLLLGTGFLQRSPVFYSFYPPVLLSGPCLSSPLLFLLAIASLLILSVIMVVRRTVIGYKHTWMLGSSYNHHMSYKVFCGWDFCTQEPKTALLQHSFLRNDLKLALEEERFHQHVAQRTCQQRARLYFLRGLLNFLVIVLLGGSFYLIYYATVISQGEKPVSWILSLLVEYLPPITITMVNFLLPYLFCSISGFEDYSLTVQVNITLVRSIILKLASLAIFLFFLHRNIKSAQCWENQFGKEMYKLVVFDFLACGLNAVLVEWPRKLLVESYPSCSLLRALGKPTFLVPFNVLDLVYSQTVTWVGLFYCPLLAHISLLKLLIVFYIKKFVLFRCCEPAQRMFRGCQSSVLFHFTLLLGLLTALVALVINANILQPSRDCGPFAHGDSLFNATAACVDTLPPPVQRAFSYFTSEAFALPLILVEIVFLTSFVSQGRANRRAIDRLKDILVMC
ncbi:transmembrane channel-like protein 7 isoform X2 [Conger conger]|nr:transmembrane channel-like protein 7 isoform X2 [Conger conger]